MRVSKKSEYAVRALVEIALRAGEGSEWRQISQIAEATRIPEKFLEQILLTLKKRGLLQSRRGVVGGYALNRQPEAIDLETIIDILDGDSAGEKEVADPGAEVYRRVMAHSEAAARAILRATTLAALAEEAQKIRGTGVGMDYHI